MTILNLPDFSLYLKMNRPSKVLWLLTRDRRWTWIQIRQATSGLKINFRSCGLKRYRTKTKTKCNWLKSKLTPSKYTEGWLDWPCPSMETKKIKLVLLECLEDTLLLTCLTSYPPLYWTIKKRTVSATGFLQAVLLISLNWESRLT